MSRTNARDRPEQPPVPLDNRESHARFLKVEKSPRAYQADKPVFADVSFTIDKGEFVRIIGHSGCGKTTILNVLAGLDTATSGMAFMDGREVSGPSLDRGWCSRAMRSCPG
ncbi:MAG: ATP-binding cassette domain-containing protein [Burkholderiaceae bacterium]